MGHGRAAMLAPASVAAAAALLVAGCGGGGTPAGTSAKISRSSARKATGAVTVTSADGPALTVGGTALSSGALSSQISGLYRAHPSLGSYVVQSTTYTQRSRKLVFAACTAGGDAELSENAQTSRLDACAPMIYFFYNYGVSRGVPAATRLAGDLLSYAADVVRGPVDSATEISTTLRGWGIRVNAPAAPRSSAAATKELAAADRAILAERSVRVTILGRKPGQTSLAERLVVDMGDNGSQEVVTEPGARAEITVTPQAAFLSGDEQGLTALLGFTARQAERAGGKWIEAAKGSKEYADLKTESTIAALPASILPASSSTVRLETDSSRGAAVRLLTWTAAVGSAENVTERLELTGGSTPLPIRERTRAAGYDQTVTFSHWSEPVAPAAPATGDVVAYASLGTR